MMFDLTIEPSLSISIAFLLLFSLFLVSDCGNYILNNLKKQLKTVVPEDNIILITGCDSGFGELAAIELTACGYNVVAACLTEEGKNRIKSLVSLSVLCDVTNENDVLHLATAIEELAAKNKLRLWAVINNAGIARFGCIDWLNLIDIKKVMDVNYFGAVSVIKATLPELKKTCNSRIINISSIAGLAGGTSLFGAYSASKHAIEGMSKCLRVELKPWNIHVCNVNPGFMKTPMVSNSPSLTRKHFEAAPIAIQNQYPDANKQIDKLTVNVDLMGEDPKVVVMAIKRLVTASNPSLVNLTGTLAFFLGFSLILPSCIGDWIGSLVGINVAPSPAALASIQKPRFI